MMSDLPDLSFGDDDEQDAYNEMFNEIVAVEDTLDGVIRSLRAVGVRIEDSQRNVVAAWLDHFAVDTPVPLGDRVSMLRGWLAEAP